MNMSSTTLALAALTIALSGCNSADTDRTTSLPRGVDSAAVVQQTPSGLSAPPAPAERGPIPPNANAIAPGTNAAQALANQPSSAKGDVEVSPQAQEAAAQAADTASADAAKKEVLSTMMATNTTATGGSQTARDTEANSPRHGTLTKAQEVNELPKAGQVNNHSSTALEKDSGR
jgi:hypothetical protein